MGPNILGQVLDLSGSRDVFVHVAVDPQVALYNGCGSVKIHALIALGIREEIEEISDNVFIQRF